MQLPFFKKLTPEEKIIERLIKRMKKDPSGVLSVNDRDTWFDLSREVGGHPHLAFATRLRMQKQGFIDFNEAEAYVVLTDKGWEFKTYKAYKRALWRKQHPVLHDIIITLLAAILALLTALYLRRLDSQEKLQEKKEREGQLEKANNRIDSLRSVLLYLQKTDSIHR